jgi:hypothetical protein
MSYAQLLRSTRKPSEVNKCRRDLQKHRKRPRRQGDQFAGEESALNPQIPIPSESCAGADEEDDDEDYNMLDEDYNMLDDAAGHGQSTNAQTGWSEDDAGADGGAGYDGSTDDSRSPN